MILIDFSGFINDLYYKPHFIDLEKMSFLLHFVLQAVILPKAPCLQICSKQASLDKSHCVEGLQLYILLLLLWLVYLLLVVVI